MIDTKNSCAAAAAAAEAAAAAAAAWVYLEACEGHLQWHGSVVADAQDVHHLKQPPQ
jgi:hypothetical protein